MGYSTGGGVSGGYSQNVGSGDKRWVNQVSRLVGSEDVVGDVESLRLTGGQIYTEGDSGISMTAKEVAVTDINDHDRFDRDGFRLVEQLVYRVRVMVLR